LVSDFCRTSPFISCAVTLLPFVHFFQNSPFKVPIFSLTSLFTTCLPLDSKVVLVYAFPSSVISLFTRGLRLDSLKLPYSTRSLHLHCVFRSQLTRLPRRLRLANSPENSIHFH
jgi:hypothetical protein